MRIAAPLMSVFLFTLSVQPWKAVPGPAFDLVIRHGTILDGSGRMRYQADIGVKNGFIMAIGDLSPSGATTAIEARGLFVAPGFINIHSHATDAGLETAVNMLTQGVTTEIVNADGMGPVGIGQQLTRLQKRKLAVNAGAYIGLNSVWRQVVHNTDRRPTSEEITRMTGLLSTGLSGGAWGVSAGLDFVPASFARTEELIAILKPVSNWRTNFTNHERLTPGSNFSSRIGITETVVIGTKAGLLPVITHMKVQGHEQGTAAQVLQSLMSSDASGVYVAADVYPYVAGAAPVEMLVVPSWAQEGGWTEMLRRFAESATRQRIVEDVESAITLRWGGPQGVYFLEERRELSDLMKEMNLRAGEAVLRMVEKGRPTAILRFGSEADLIQILQHPATSMACDCGATTSPPGHPRFFGSFPRLLGRYVRDQHIMSWEEAIRKSTALPAATIGMVDRGIIALGMAADIAVFDPNTIVDRATYDAPSLLSEGMRYVIVNGQVALSDGRTTGLTAGRPLVRTPNMPSRRAPGDGRVMQASATAHATRFTMDVIQSASDSAARGRFTFQPVGSKTSIAVTAFGQLQTTAHWASFTGIAGPADNSRAILVIIDQDHPTKSGKTRFAITIDGVHAWADTVPNSRVSIQ